MPPRRCPHCKSIYFANPHSGDFIHNCNIPGVGSTLANEDVAIVGNWEDYTGTGTRPKQAVMMAGVSNEAGPGARAEGEDIDKLTNRGHVANTHRQRRHLQYIKDPMTPND